MKLPDTVLKFLDVIGKKPRGICALTIGVDYESLSGTFIFDADTSMLEKHYPGHLGRGRRVAPQYITVGGVKWTVNWSEGLPRKEERGTARGDWDRSNVFCCDDCTPEKSSRTTSNDADFRAFRHGEARTLPFGFCVTTKIQRGPLISQRTYVLRDGVRVKQQEHFEHHLNTFKAYTCEAHNTYVAIDLCTKDPTATQHHAKAKNETLYGPKIIEKLEECLR